MASAILVDPGNRVVCSIWLRPQMRTLNRHHLRGARTTISTKRTTGRTAATGRADVVEEGVATTKKSKTGMEERG